MKRFGDIKNRLITKLTNCYNNGDKKELKKILSIIREDKNFVNLYLIYEDIESKYINDKDIAKIYVDELDVALKGKMKSIINTMNKLDSLLDEDVSGNVEPYNFIDDLLVETKITDTDKRLVAKKKLVEYLLKEKTNDELNTPFTTNEKLLITLLTNNFNVAFDTILDENGKKELQEILSISDDDIERRVNESKDDILNKISTMLSESTDNSLINKLETVRDEVNKLKPSRSNWYKLKELKNGLN